MIQVNSHEIRLVECVNPKTGEQIIGGYENGILSNEAVYDAKGVLLRVNIYVSDNRGQDLRIYRIGSGDGTRIPYLIDACNEKQVCSYSGEGVLHNNTK